MSEQYGTGLHLHLISRQQAKALGMTYYFTGKPCKRGGIGVRVVSSTACLCKPCLDYRSREEARESRSERERRYYKESRESRCERSRLYYNASREAALCRMRRYYEENSNGILERGRRRRKERPHVCRAREVRRSAEKLQRVLLGDCELTRLVEREAYDLACDRLDQTGVEWHVDHMLPLRGDEVSGFHHWSNLQVIPAAMNMTKSNKMMYIEPFEWLKDA